MGWQALRQRGDAFNVASTYKKDNFDAQLYLLRTSE